MKERLVSVISPAYNTGNYISRLLDSVLNQTYPDIEMIVVDDGSTDNTRAVVEKYIPKFKKRGYELIYIFQDNSGQSVAIQNALSRITGEYLVWPDSDDYYASPEAIEKMVARFDELGDNIGMVRTQEVIVEDNADHLPIKTKGLNANEIEDKSLFIDCMLQKNGYYYCSGVYMLKYQYFINSSELPIYTNKDAGQNWQLMLPILYHYQCSTILEPLYNVVSRSDSHSRQQKSYDERIKRIKTYETTIIETLKRIKGLPQNLLEEYILMVSVHYAQLYLEVNISEKRISEATSHFKFLAKHNGLKPGLTIKYLLLRLGLFSLAKSLRNITIR